jgi:outer membrane protein OmpA-like peptidoglycan-associated protein
VTRNSFYKQAKVKDGTAITLELAHASRSASGQWSALTPIQFRSAEYSIGHPAISSDGSTLYFSSNMPGSVGGSDIFVSHLENGVWSAPRNLGPGINTPGQELFPYLYNDSILYFSSTGHPGLGGLDIFRFNLKATNAAPVHLELPINSAGDDFGIFFDKDEVSGFFSSNRQGEGNDDIYFFEEVTRFIEIKLYDSATHRGIREAKLNLIENQKVVANAVSNLTGQAEFRLSSSRDYQLTIVHPNYKPFQTELTPTKWPVDQQGTITIYLSPVTLHAISNVAGTGILIRDRRSVTNTLTFSSAPLDVDVAPETLAKPKEGTLSPDSSSAGHFKVVVVEHVNALPSVMLCVKDSIYDFHAASETALRNNSLGWQIQIPHGARRNDYEQIITEQIKARGYSVNRFLLIRSFYFDSEKTLIRNDASAQLDKIIEVMVSYPQVDVQLTFHADSRGSEKFNLELSRRRSEETLNYLMRAGIGKERIISDFVGESQLLNDCGDLTDCDELLHQMNRTTEFKLIVRGQTKKEWYGRD